MYIAWKSPILLLCAITATDSCDKLGMFNQKGMGPHHTTVLTTHHRQIWSHGTESLKDAYEDTRDEWSHLFQTSTLLLLQAFRLLLRLRIILKHQLRLLLTLQKFQVTHVKKILSILPHKAKYMSWLFCLQYNTNGWNGHETSKA